jgi:hypothetical protein
MLSAWVSILFNLERNSNGLEKIQKETPKKLQKTLWGHNHPIQIKYCLFRIELQLIN